MENCEYSFDVLWHWIDEAKSHKIPSIDQVIFKPPRTIVNWNDGTKTIVKIHNEEFDEEKGLAMAIARKYFGSRAAYNKIIDSANRQ